MNKSQQDFHKRLTTIQHFLDIYAEALAPINRGTARAELDELVSAAMRLAAVQVAATERSRSQTALLQDLRVNLRTIHLQPILAVASARIGRTRAAVRFKLPSKNVSDLALVAEALSVAAVLRKRKSALVSEYFGADCLDQLVAAAEALKAGGDEAIRYRLQILSATKELADVTRRGRALVRFLNALVTSKARGNKRVLTAWRKAAGIARQEPAPRSAPAVTAVRDESRAAGE
jgi:hypothetical protein